jgi:hypothetical protein
MQRSWKLLASVIAIGMTAHIAAAEDLTIVSKVTSAMGGPSTSTQYITGDKIRMNSGEGDTIVDLESGTLVMIDHKKKKYSKTTFDQMRDHFAQMSEMVEGNPMMAQMMGEVSEVQVTKTSETREILGYTCTKYLLEMDDSFRQTLWVTPELKIPAQYYEASKAMYAMMGPMATRFEKMFDQMKEIDGFSLASSVDMRVMGQDASTSSEVVEVTRGTISDDVFAVPAGYKMKKSPFDD